MKIVIYWSSTTSHQGRNWNHAKREHHSKNLQPQHRRNNTCNCCRLRIYERSNRNRLHRFEPKNQKHQTQQQRHRADWQRKGTGILIYGKARVEYNNVYQTALSVWEKAIHAPRDKVERLVKAYLDTVKYVIIKITPQHIVTFDTTKDDVFNNLVKTYIRE